jgi:hypothetical protein
VDPRPEFCGEAVSEMLLRGKHFSVAVRQGGVSYVLGENAAPALFDQNADPREQANLAGRGLPTEARLHDRALEIFAAARSVDADRRAIDDQTIEQIRAMGYVE